MKKLLLIALCLTAGMAIAKAQSLQVKGSVKDEAGLPISGASVTVKGTRAGTTTGANGSFTLTAPGSRSILVFSAAGYTPVEKTAEATMEVTLGELNASIDEVVVTGMFKQDKRLNTGATDRLTADNVKLGGMPDISRGLEGRAAGVSVQNVSATFGTAPKIRIRGATSILGDNKPLWVLDGVIVEDVTEVSADMLSSGDAVTMITSAVAGLNADDIESFQILKDGSATSIYGARAMSGVIVITTKRGKAGVTKVNYTGEFTSRLKPSYREYNIMNSQEQMGIYKELQEKGFLELNDVLRRSESGEYGRMYNRFKKYDAASSSYYLSRADDSAINAFLKEAEYRNTDWFDELFSNSVMMNHSVSISSGTQRYNSYVSMSVMTDPGWYRDSNVERYTLNANASYNILPKLNFTILGNGSYRKQKAPGTLAQNIDAVKGEVKRDFDINPFSYAMNTSRTLDPSAIYVRNFMPFNINDELENNYIDLNVFESRFQGELKWNVLRGLDVGILAAATYKGTSQQHHIKDNSNQAQAYRRHPDDVINDSNRFLYTDPDDPQSLPISVIPQGGLYNKRDYGALSYDMRAYVSYDKTFASKHIVNFYGGMETNSTKRNNDYFRGVGLQYLQGEIPFYVYQYFKQGLELNDSYFSVENTNKKIAAFFGTGTYSYMRKYSLTGTMRYEGTNRLGKARSARWLPTWNISGGWNMHEESFFDNLRPALSHLMLRASYSLTADAGPSYITNSTAIMKSYTPWRPEASDMESGLYIQHPANNALTYEKKHELNIGFDMGLLDNRINLGMDFYRRNNFDLLGLTNTQGGSGKIELYANIADMKSSGVEATLSTRNIDHKDFKWTTDFTFAYMNNEVTKLQPVASMIDLVRGGGYSLEGYPQGSVFSIPFVGLDDAGLPIFMIVGQRVTKENYDEINFQDTKNTSWLKYEGPTDPKFMGGFGNVVSWKNLRLNIFMTYSFGNVVRLNSLYKYMYDDLYATQREFVNRWMAPGDELTTNVPVIASRYQANDMFYLPYGYNAYNYSTERIAKGDFIRLKEVSLSYDFPKEIASRMKFESLGLRLQVTNPLLIYSDKRLQGQDPEYYQSGGVSSPLAKQFTLTVKVGF
ncbi:MAG: SusC/RagA family TonB-linked outer membrane protein [Rikenellaceae bacterium]|jgi:TonB-linked SusC/RagA family outer membrane protein|nr:SusC/RagA family TonB-linked outer membrane protein [Rikenellaceae bacterium]